MGFICLRARLLALGRGERLDSWPSLGRFSIPTLGMEISDDLGRKVMTPGKFQDMKLSSQTEWVPQSDGPIPV